ncbi:hypothetical protein AWV80_00145 [Cupriavidus sp. UYMU48A]|nr:hypothetical protein AWV80_00145 [Cupriavidus sp. UYMU48A]
MDRQSIGGIVLTLLIAVRERPRKPFLLAAAGEEDRESDGTQRRAAQCVTQFGLRGVRRALL